LVFLLAGQNIFLPHRRSGQTRSLLSLLDSMDVYSLFVENGIQVTDDTNDCSPKAMILQGKKNVDGILSSSFIILFH
jgi:hypothetical protein